MDGTREFWQYRPQNKTDACYALYVMSSVMSSDVNIQPAATSDQKVKKGPRL